MATGDAEPHVVLQDGRDPDENGNRKCRGRRSSFCVITWIPCSKKSDFPEAFALRQCGAPSATGRLSRLRQTSRFELLYLRLVDFGIVAAAEFKSLEKRWAKHRKENSLDRNGKPDPALSTGSDSQGPDRHLHDPISELMTPKPQWRPHPSPRSVTMSVGGSSSAPASTDRDRLPVLGRWAATPGSVWRREDC